MIPWRTAWPLLPALLLATRAMGAPCPAAGVITIVTDHHAAAGTVMLDVSGIRLDSPGGCDAPGELSTSYATTMVCAGPGVARCGTIDGLAPGVWVHRVELQVPGSAPQIQARQDVVLGGDASNVVEWTVYGRTFVVDAVTPFVTALDAAAAFTAGGSLPALVRFDRVAFPGASNPVTIGLQTAPACALDTCALDQRETAHCFEGSRITVDALDDDGLPGGVVLGTAGCHNSVLRLYGSDNVLRGLVFAGSTDDTPTIAVDTVAVAGIGASGNRFEQCTIGGPTLGDALSVENQAGTPAGPATIVIADSEVFGAQDKGIKVVGGGFVSVERSCVHDNQHGGIQATLGGTAYVVESTIQHNVRTIDEEDSAPEHGLLVGVPNDAADHNLLMTRGNVIRFNGVRGISVVNNATASLQQDVVTDNYFAGLIVETTQPDVVPEAIVRGSAFVCNYAGGLCLNQPGKVCRTDDECQLAVCSPAMGASASSGLGVGLRDLASPETLPASVDLGTGGANAGRNALAFNRNEDATPPGINLRSDLVLAAPLAAAGNQWEHCDVPEVDPVNPNRCYVEQVAAMDVELGSGATAANLGTPIGPRHGPDPIVTEISPGRPRAGELVRVYGGSFNAIDGADCHPGVPADPCSAANPNVVTRNAESPSQGNHVTVTIDGQDFDGPVHQVTPTMLVFEMPVDCYAPGTLTVARGNDMGTPVSFCDPAGCTGRPAGAVCDDQDACTVGETCQPTGACEGAPIVCTGQCFTGTCDPASGCIVRPVSAACEDGDACTTGDHCDGSGDVCLPGGPTSCAGACLTGACEPVVGCVPRPATVACDDADACTTGDHCSGIDGACVGAPLACDDAKPCTLDACDPASGCTHAMLDGSPCPAPDACHAAGTCAAGECAAAPVPCDDAEACTEDGCDALTGCLHVVRAGLDGVTCHPTQLRTLVAALGDDLGAFAQRLRKQITCAEQRITAAGAAAAGSATQKRHARRARRCLRRFIQRVERKRLSTTQRERLIGAAEAAVMALERHFGV